MNVADLLLLSKRHDAEAQALRKQAGIILAEMDDRELVAVGKKSGFTIETLKLMAGKERHMIDRLVIGPHPDSCIRMGGFQ